MNIHKNLFFSYLSDAAENHPKRIAILDTHKRTLNYQQLENAIKEKQRWLTATGLRPGNAIVALLPNAIETIILFLASMRAGLIYAPLPCTATLPEIIRWKKITKATVCLVAHSINENIQTQISTLSWKTMIITIGGTSYLDEVGNVPAESDGALVMPSSGSTGEPKAILISFARLFSAANAFLSFHHLEKTPIRFWNYLPMSYLGGLFNLTLIPLSSGGSIFVDEAFSGKTFLGFWETIERHAINALWLVPSILRGLLLLAKRVGQSRHYPAIPVCFLGTAPISLDEKKEFEKIFSILPLENYGLSETTFITSEKKETTLQSIEKSVGIVMPNVEIKFRINPENNSPEVLVKTPFLMLGYLTENGLLPPNLDEDGFIATGDYGELIDNQLKLTGRYRDIIKKGGVLVLLCEIENTVRNYPDIIDVAAVGIEHPFYGESFNLYISISDRVVDQASFVRTLKDWLHKQIAKEKWPENVIVCQHIPKTTSGKIQKHLLRQWSIKNEVHAN